MKPKLVGRRALMHTALTSAAWYHPQLTQAVPPPKGSVYLLAPLVQQRLLLAECSAAISSSANSANMTSLLALFDGPPFTRSRAAGIGSLFRDAASQYEGSLEYSRELSKDDRLQCFPRRDEDCIRLQRDSDRLFRELLINKVLGMLQAVEEELVYLSSCERGVAPGVGAVCPATITGEELEELKKCLRDAGASFDRYFDVVPAADARAAVGIVAKTSPRWDLLPLEDSATAAAAPADGGIDPTAAGARSSTLAMRLSAADDDNSAADSANSTTSDTPTTMALARFALPTLAAWLVSPLMSLVDTAVVGRDSVTALSLAALGPATMVGDSMAYLFSFLGVATTNLVATARSEERRDRSGAAPGSAPGAREVADLFGNAVRLAVLCGLGSAILQLALGRAVLARYTAARSAALVAPAYQYVRVRALGAPAALLVRVGTATCLALKDPLAPLLAVALGGALNVALDLLLVTWLGRGIGGAAWATVVSEAVCAAVVLRAARIKLAAEPATAGEAPFAPQQPSPPPRRHSPLPSRATASAYAAFAKPLVLTTAGKIATYSSLAHVATTVSVAGTAAHRVLMCVYWFMWPFAETWSQVAQAFLPGSKAPRALTRRLLACGAAVGLASAASTAGVLAFAPQLFTRSPEAMSITRSLMPLVASCTATVGLMCAMEGALLATRRLRFLSRFYTINAVAMVAAFRAVEGYGLGLHAAWTCMLTFSVVRVCAFALALWRRNVPPDELSAA